MPLAVMVTSLVRRLDPERGMRVHVIDGGIRREDRDRLERSIARRNVEMEWIPGPATSRPELPAWGRLRPAVYERLSVAEYLPDAVKAIWLDCDLVVEEDLSRLWDADMGDRHALAVQDMVVPYVSSPMGVARHSELGIAESTKYFNAGVMVVNLDRWREDRIAEGVMAYLESNWDDIFFLEQEGLNVVLVGRWGELDPRWNQNAGVAGRSFYRPDHMDAATYERLVRDPWIVHFTGYLKPWGLYSEPRSRALYFRHLEATPWAGHRPRRGAAERLLRVYEATRIRDVLYPMERRALQVARRISRSRQRGPGDRRSRNAPVEVASGK